MSAEIEWVDPLPEPAVTRAAEVAEQLRARPNRWALVARDTSPVFGWWRELARDPQIETKLRPHDPAMAWPRLGNLDVYARYIGEAERHREGAPATS